MPTRLVVDLYAWIIEIALWLVLLVFGVVGFQYALGVLNDSGLVFQNPAAWRVVGGLLFAVGGFIVFAVLVGPFLILVDIRKSVRALEMRDSVSGRTAPHPSR